MPRKVCTVKVDEHFIIGSCRDTETGKVKPILLGKEDQDFLKKLAEIADWELKWE